MRIQELSFIPRRPRASGRRLGFVLACGSLAAAMSAGAQSANGGGTPPAPADGFSIETEMFTYRALESNTQAIACDIAAYINDTDVVFNKPSSGAVCTVKSLKKSTVVLMPFASNQLQDFQIWRADMATMARLHRGSRADCPSVGESSSKGATAAAASTAATAKPSLLASLLTASPPLAVAQSILAAMASNTTATSVGGTIQDQAFMNGIARELHRLQVPVLIPTAYTPYSLVSLDETVSPFLSFLDRALDDRAKCMHDAAADGVAPSKPIAGKPARPAGQAAAAENRALLSVSAIDDFLSTLSGEPVIAPKSLAAPSGTASGAAAPMPTSTSPGKGAAPPSGTPVAAPVSGSHLSAVLMADGLAARLGVDPATGKLSSDDQASVHVLLVQALESGGSVTRTTRWFNTKVSYSGGSVGTYALFSLEGDVECSGNVYEYGGSANAKDFHAALAEYAPDPSQQLVFLRNSCRPMSASP